jgi:hypothetical protein
MPAGSSLDFVAQIRRVVEYLTAAQSFARTMGCAEESTSLACRFRWTGLSGRRLVSRQDPGSISPRPPAVQPEVVSQVELPLGTPPTALGPLVSQTLAPLFLAFGGAVFQERVVDGWVQQIIGQRMG